MQPLCTDFVSQIHHGFSHETALGFLYTDAMLLQSCEDDCEVAKVRFNVWTGYEDVTGHFRCYVLGMDFPNYFPIEFNQSCPNSVWPSLTTKCSTKSFLLVVVSNDFHQSNDGNVLSCVREQRRFHCWRREMLLLWFFWDYRDRCSLVNLHSKWFSLEWLCRWFVHASVVRAIARVSSNRRVGRNKIRMLRGPLEILLLAFRVFLGSTDHHNMTFLLAMMANCLPDQHL